MISIMTAGTAWAFPDTTNSPYSSAINYLYNNGVISGYPNGDFLPLNTLTRAELLKIAIGAATKSGFFLESDLDSFANKSCFSDVQAGNWYTKYICFAKSKKIVQGYPDGTFRPDKQIYFSEAYKIIMVSFNYFYPTTDPWYEGVMNSFNSMYKMTDKSPIEYITRQEMADAVVRAMLKSQDQDGGSRLASYSQTLIVPENAKNTKITETTVTMSAPVLKNPPNDPNYINSLSPDTETINFNWSTVQNAQSYELIVFTGAGLIGFDMNVGNNVNYALPLSSLNPIIGKNNYAWYVKAIGTGGVSTTSNYGYFTYTKSVANQTVNISFLQPSQGTVYSSIPSQISFQWTPTVTDAVLNVTYINQNKTLKYPVSGTSYTLYSGSYQADLSASGGFCWKLEKAGTSYNATPYSYPCVYYVPAATLNTPVLNSPANQTTLYNGNQNVIFKWNATPGAIRYTLMVSFDNLTWVSYQNLGDTQWTVQASAFPPIDSFGGNDISWKVQAFDSNNNSTISTQWGFTVSDLCGPPNACY